MGQPPKGGLEEAEQRPLLGTWEGHTEELREKAGVCWGQPGGRGREEIKDESVPNEASGGGGEEDASPAPSGRRPHLSPSEASLRSEAGEADVSR